MGKEKVVRPPGGRRPPRHRRISTNGLIVHSHGRHSFGCIIRDLSVTGARVTIPTDVQLPARLYVIHLRDQTAYDSDVVWFQQGEAGLAFRRKLLLGQLTAPELAYLKKLWFEISQR
jgi:hypothetical protein